MKRNMTITSLANSEAAERARRRGNTIVLVTGILVLLVIIATAYVTRTQAGRTTASAYLTTGQRENNRDVIVEQFAQEIAEALFVREAFTSNSNDYRAAILPDAVRYGVDRGTNFKFNFAPYSVVPWTNWPDDVFHGGPLTAAQEALWPKGAGNPNGGGAGTTPLIQALLAGEGNPIGNPGFGDTRWLRDLEPLRWDTNNDGIPEAFSHWRHMTNIARADNAWRIPRNINDIDGATGFLLTDLTIPVEQWLAMRAAPSRFGITGDAIFPGQALFEIQWCRWFGADATCIDGATTEARLANHAAVMLDPTSVPHNFYRLSDLDADGVLHEIGERAEDEFIPGTARWNVSRVLADSDGDGFTDSFWFLAPTPIQNGVRQVVAVSIIDNSGMLNAGVATRFLRNDLGLPAGAKKTTGLTPSDLALVSNLATGDFLFGGHWGNWNCGFYDCPDHHYPIDAFSDLDGIPPSASSDYHMFDYDAPVTTQANLATGARPWQRHMQSLGFSNTSQVTTFDTRPFSPTRAMRLDFWRRCASRMLAADVASGYLPFSTGDELELRMYHGQNSPWIYSRFENAVQDIGADEFGRFLHAGQAYEETNEYVKQRTNRKLLVDKRRMLTLFSAARNDQAPRWLWQFQQGEDLDGAGPLPPGDFNEDLLTDQIDSDLFDFGRRKFDLRLGPIAELIGPFGPTGNFQFANIDVTVDAVDYNYKLALALRERLEKCLIDPQSVPGNLGTYYGYGTADANKTRELCAAYAANIVQWRDRDQRSLVSEAMPVGPDPATGTVNNPNSFMGMEAQPFLLEAFIGHVYKAQTVPPADVDGDAYSNAGEYVLLNDAANRTTVVAVQIANPFNVPIDLKQYKISLFGQELDLSTVTAATPPATMDTSVPPAVNWWLEPATEDRPTTAVFYAAQDVLNGDLLFHEKWKNFLDLDFQDRTPNSIVAKVADTIWSQDRAIYDSSVAAAIELSRKDPVSGEWVVIDRIDPANDRDFGNAVNEMGTAGFIPPDAPVPLSSADIPFPGELYPVGVRLGSAALGYKHWVQWRRVTRAWGVDLNANKFYDPNEKNPRFIYNDRVVVRPAGTLVQDPNADGPTYTFGGNRYKFDRDPDADPASLPQPGMPWFTRSYRSADNVQVPDQPLPSEPFPRKPTFFDMNLRRDPANPASLPANPPPCSDPYHPYGFSYPDKGWYTQRSHDITDEIGNLNPIRLNYPLQMLHKDDDFEQVGELLNVWLYGHEISTANLGFGISYTGTIRTFSEMLAQSNQLTVGRDLRINRLQVETTSGPTLSAVIGVADASNAADPRHSTPALPAGARIFDAFVCDGPGVNISDVTGATAGVPDGSIDLRDVEFQRLMNAKRFDGTATPGMINVNTAFPEVMRANPHWYRLVHETGEVNVPPGPCAAPAPLVLFNYDDDFTAAPPPTPLVVNSADPTALLPRNMIAESIVQYRERFNGQIAGAVPTPLNPTGEPAGPNYETRGAATNGPRGERGIASLGELMLLTQKGTSPIGYLDRATAGTTMDRIYDQFWRVDMGMPAGLANPNPNKPIWGIYPGTAPVIPYQASMRLSTDRVQPQNVTGDCNSNGTADWLDIVANFNLDLNGNWIIDTCENSANPAVIASIRVPDETAGDSEEAGMLFAGASNMLTTRSDTFTVYFRIRSFRQNLSVNPPVWDATNPEYIIDDSRYVMLVDRSLVNKPGDKPRILYLEKLPH